MKKNILPIAVLIPTMNRPRALKRTIDSYLSAEYIPRQIVVVDQSETEECSEENKKLLSKISEIKTTYYHQKKPSLTMARNRALKLADEDVIICSDDDVDVYQNTIKNVFDIMKDDSVSMIAGWDDNMPRSYSKIGYFIGTKSFINRNKGHVTYSMLGRFPEKISIMTETMWAMGFFFVVRKSLVEKWNIEWDEKLLGYAYAEDLDFSYNYYKKSKREHKKCIFSKKVHVLHLASQEYRTPGRKSTFMYVLHRYYLNQKHNRGILGELAIAWCNYWMYFQRSQKKQGEQDMRDAMKYYRRHKKEVLMGKFEYE